MFKGGGAGAGLTFAHATRFSSVFFFFFSFSFALAETGFYERAGEWKQVEEPKSTVAATVSGDGATVSHLEARLTPSGGCESDSAPFSALSHGCRAHRRFQPAGGGFGTTCW